MPNATLLVELLTEELPPKALKALGTAFADRIAQGLVQAQLASADAEVTMFATPRRLGVAITGVLDRAPDRIETKKLMPAKVAYDANGSPTAALTKRLEKEGVAITALSTRSEGAVDQVWLEQSRAGSSLAAGLQAALDDALAKLPIPKRMSYQRTDDAGIETTVQFVRPAHGLVALHGRDVVDIRALGIAAGRITAGHRFMGMRHVALADADAYVKILHDDGKVVAGFAERRERIRAQLVRAAGGDRVVMPDALLDEVTALVEWPAVYRGTFDTAFLDVPQECLILTMQQNQKYFALTDTEDRIVDRFLVVSNIETDEPSLITGGNERVLRARLADAKFFFDQDQKTRLDERIEKLRTVVYHNQLGSQYDRMLRVEALSARIAEMLGFDETDARRAARLAKTDLVTDMVGEFPELQGLMGRYYALHYGEKPDVAAAIEEQYRPRFAGDALPATDIGTCLALADKLDTLTGMFSIGATPTGDKDPFALRRQALGVVRLLIERKLDVPLNSLLDVAAEAYPAGSDAPRPFEFALEQFIFERLRSYLVDQGHKPEHVDAVIENTQDKPYELSRVPEKIADLAKIAEDPAIRSLAAANKRISNILKKTAVTASELRPGLLIEPAELVLSHQLGTIGADSIGLAQQRKYFESLMLLASLGPAVDDFFDNVMVMSDDADVRANRIFLLHSLRITMNRIADLSKLAA